MKTTLKHRRLGYVLESLFCVAPILNLAAATFSLNPGLDTFVANGPTGNLKSNNYGGAGALSVAAPGLAQGEFQSVLQFDISAAKASFDTQYGAGNWSVQSISLQLTATIPNNAIFNASGAGQFRINWIQNDSWVEGTGTPQAPSATGINFSTISNFVGAADETLGTFSFNGATSGNFSYGLFLTPLFTSELMNGSAASFRIFAADSTVSALFDSRSLGTASARPLLTITAVPEPGAIDLSLAAFACLAGVRARGRSKSEG